MLKNLLLKVRNALIFDENKINNEYLNQARDIQDLENRMRYLDKLKSRNNHLYY